MKKRPRGGAARANLTKEKILVEAARVFNRRGYDAATLGEIADRLGVTQAALYYYVKSKDDVLYQCHKKANELGMHAIHVALAQTSAPDAQLRILFREYIEGMTDQLAGAVVLLYEGALPSRLHRQILKERDEYESLLRGIIKAGVEGGLFRSCTPKVIGFAILGALNWISRWYRPDGPLRAKDIAEEFGDCFVRGLLRAPAAEGL